MVAILFLCHSVEQADGPRPWAVMQPIITPPILLNVKILSELRLETRNIW